MNFSKLPTLLWPRNSQPAGRWFINAPTPVSSQPARALVIGRGTGICIATPPLSLRGHSTFKVQCSLERARAYRNPDAPLPKRPFSISGTEIHLSKRPDSGSCADCPYHLFRRLSVIQVRNEGLRGTGERSDPRGEQHVDTEGARLCGLTRTTDGTGVKKETKVRCCGI